MKGVDSVQHALKKGLLLNSLCMLNMKRNLLTSTVEALSLRGGSRLGLPQLAAHEGRSVRDSMKDVNRREASLPAVLS